MARLPVCSGRDAIRAFERAGWAVDCQKGSHVSLVKEGVPGSSPSRSTASWTGARFAP